MKNNYIKLGKIIKYQREKLGYSKRKLAKICGVSDTEISRIENGERQIPNLVTLISICETLELDFVELLKITNYFVNKKEKEYEVKVKKIEEESFKVDAIDEENAMDIIANYLQENHNFSLKPNEKIELEAIEIDENQEDFFSECNEKDCETCKFYCPYCEECTYED